MTCKEMEQENSSAKSPYAIRGLEFYVNDERVPVDPRSVRIALVCHRLETGRDLRGGEGPLPMSISRSILRMERARSPALLAAELSRLDRASALAQEEEAAYRAA